MPLVQLHGSSVRGYGLHATRSRAGSHRRDCLVLVVTIDNFPGENLPFARSRGATALKSEL